MTDRITNSDIDQVLANHVQALESVGITYDGRLGIDHGSKTYGRAFRLFHTGYLIPCYKCESTTDGNGECGDDRCHDGLLPTTGHGRPPIGSDYLGMTKREAFTTMIERTNLIYDVVRALEDQS